jgi:hypothetical protein
MMKQAILILALAGFVWSPLPLEAAPLGITRSAVEQPDSNVEKVARFAGRGRVGAVGVRRGAVVGPRGGVAVRRGAVAVGPRGAVATGRTAVVRPVRPWVRRPYFGTVIGGVALGTIIAATAVGVAPAAPAPNTCWYWTDPARTQGYWDYCR